MPCFFFSSWIYLSCAEVWGLATPSPNGSLVCSRISSRQLLKLMRLCFARSCSKAASRFSQAHRDIHPLNFYFWAKSEDRLSKSKVVSMQITDHVIPHPVFSIVDWLCNLNSVGAMKFVKLIGIAHIKLHRTTLGIGRALGQKDLHTIQQHAGKRRRITPGKAQTEAELFSVELHGSKDVTHHQSCVHLIAVDLWNCGGGHKSLLSSLSSG